MLSSWSVLSTAYHGTRVPREPAFALGAAQAAQAFCLLLLTAKSRVVRSKGKTLDDRYDTETTSCYTGLCYMIQSNWKCFLSHAQKAQLVRMISGQPKVNS